MSKSKIFLMFLVSFIAGVGAGSFIYFSIYFIWTLFLFAAVAAIIGFSRKTKGIVIGGFVLIFFVFGAFWFNFQEKEKPDLSPLYGVLADFSGTIYEEPRNALNSKQIKIQINRIDGDGVQDFKILAITRRYPEFFIGDEIRLSGILAKPENFNGFDHESYLAKDDIYGAVSFPRIEKIGKSENYKFKFLSELSRIKNSFEENLSLVLPEPNAAFLKGILLGDRETLPKNLTDDFRRTGTSHIVALSGYNITILARVIVWILLFLYIPFRFSFWIASVFILLFVVMTGASASVVRAAVMGILVLFARKEDRTYKMTNALVFAGALMIFQNPKILRFDAAFQLSFLATVGLVYLSPKIESFLDGFLDKIKEAIYGSNYPKKQFIKEVKVKKGKAVDLKKILVETLSAQIMVLPLLIYLFGQISVISPIANIFVLAVMPYSMLFGFLTGIAGFIFQPLALIFGWASWILIEFQIKTIELFSKLPIASYSAGKAVLIFILALYCAVLFKLFKKNG